jgi:hypothetical protein
MLQSQQTRQSAQIGVVSLDNFNAFADATGYLEALKKKRKVDEFAHLPLVGGSARRSTSRSV